jgi:uncharacterized membrane protein
MKCGCPARKSAIATCGVSFPISVGLIGYGLYGVFFAGSGGFFSAMNVFVGLWMMMQTYQLWVLIQNGTYMQHPLFQGIPDGEDSQDDSRRSDRI